MPILRTGRYTENGRLQGCFVYLLMCQEQDQILIKSGLANDPIQRFADIMVGCPLIPEVLAICEIPNRRKAFEIETALHRAFRQWHSHGEWFRFSSADKPAFNMSWKIVLEDASSPSWPLKWTKLSARALYEDNIQRKSGRRFGKKAPPKRPFQEFVTA